MVERKTYRIQWITLAVALFAACAILRAQSRAVPRATEWGQAIDGLQISLYLASDKIDHLRIPDVALAIRNTGKESKKVVLGGYCGPEVPGADTSFVGLFLTNTAGVSQELEDWPGPPLEVQCSGEMYFFVRYVAPGATVTVPVDLDCYYVKKSALAYAWIGGGAYSLRAEIKLRDADGRVVSATTVTSNQLDVRFASNVASRRCFLMPNDLPCEW